MDQRNPLSLQILAAIAVKNHPTQLALRPSVALKLGLGLIVNKTADGLVVFHDNTLLPADNALIRAARDGDVVGVLTCCSWGARMDSGLIDAAATGRENIVRALLQMRRITKDNDGFLTWGAPRKASLAAAEHGYEDIITLCGVDDYDEILTVAAKNGHEHIVRFCHERGATAFDSALTSAARWGHVHMVQMLGELGATSFDRAMIKAARWGHESFVEACREWGATNFNDSMAKAAYGGYGSVVTRCHEWAQRISTKRWLKRRVVDMRTS